MQQLLDTYSLINDSDEIRWNLVTISKNSPLVAVIEATSFIPGIDVETIAQSQKNNFQSKIKDINNGIVPTEWIDDEKHTIVQRLFKNSTNGIGILSIDLNNTQEPITIDKHTAQTALETIENYIPKYIDSQVHEGKYKELGSVEGHFDKLLSYRNKPAIKIKRIPNGEEIWCFIPDDLRDKFSDHTKPTDIWSKKRVLVSGEILYHRSGSIVQVTATDIDLIAPTTTTIEDIKDSDFTDGMSAIEYLNMIRE